MMQYWQYCAINIYVCMIWCNYIMRELQWLQYFKLVFLEIQNGVNYKDGCRMHSWLLICSKDHVRTIILCAFLV